MNIQSEIFKIRFNQSEGNYKLIFKEIQKDNFCEVNIRSFDAKNIALSKENIISDRLKSYDLIINILNALSVKIDKVIINKQNNQIFSKIIILTNNQKIEIVSNFVDSISLALKTFSIILINKKLYGSNNSFIHNDIRNVTISKENNLSSDISLLEKLEKTLVELIAKEQYEHAAVIRDRINQLKGMKKIN